MRTPELILALSVFYLAAYGLYELCMLVIELARH